MSVKDEQESEERGRALRQRFGTEALRRMFINRENDHYFAHVGEPLTSPFAPKHHAIWTGFEIATESLARPEV